VVKRFPRPVIGTTQPPVTGDQWVALVHAKHNDSTLDPATVPPRREPSWEKFWTLRYNVVGTFKTPEEQARIPYAGAMEGGGGKMPTFPHTYAGKDGKKLAIMLEAQTQSWSIVSCEAAPSGQIVDG
jgi:hypothetical protein